MKIDHAIPSLLRPVFLGVLVGLICVSPAHPVTGAALETAPSFPPTTSFGEISRIRVFDTPLVSIGGEPSTAENESLAAALARYGRRSNSDDFSSLTDFLAAHPDSKWAASLLTSLGTEYYNTAHYSKAIDAWERAWELSKHVSAQNEKAVADSAVGHLAGMYSRLGRISELRSLLESLEQRELLGGATEKIAAAKQALWMMENEPGFSFRCGPMALDRILAARQTERTIFPLIMDSRSTTNGFSLAQVAELSRKLGMNYQMAFREKGATVVLPAVVHWRVGHYAGVIRQENGQYLLQDPTFGNDTWASVRALDTEASGYFLIPPGDLPAGWRAVQEEEGTRVWGKGAVAGSEGNATSGRDAKAKGGGKGCGMADYDIHLLLVSLNIFDTPVGYDPPVGPEIYFTATYNQREANQPVTFYYSNLGQKWTFNWLAYIQDNPNSPSANVNYYVEGGGTFVFSGFNSTNQAFGLQARDQSRLVRTSPNSYELRYPDGAKKVFAQSDGATGTSRRIFLTRVYDAMGNFVSLNYDSNLRVTSIADAVGQTTVFSYENTNDIFKITKVTDPFGRFARFSYNAAGALTNITDVLGLNSQCKYGANSFITNLTTPYGTTTFTNNENGVNRWIEATDPEGQTERVEFSGNIANLPYFSEPFGSLPQGMFTGNWYLYVRNSYYWNKRAYAAGGKSYSQAQIYHWLHDASNMNVAAGVLESEKSPLEGRVWYNYPGQAQSHYGAIITGTFERPSRIGRRLDDGTTQLYQYQYNDFGNVTNATDPAGRNFSFIYATNGIDLLEVRQTRGTNNDLLARFTHNAQHQPLTVIDAAGQTNTYTYNARGQLVTSTNPKGETQTLSYDSNGYLIRLDDTLPGTNDVTRLTYDGFGRMRSVTNHDGYGLVFDYDVFDRLTKTTYPDGTDEQITYDRLDFSGYRDRLGRQKNFVFNSLRQLTEMRDALNRVTRLNWCGCGDLESLIDPMGRMTSWLYDAQGRLTSKTYADGSRIEYGYDSASRLKSARDEKGELTAYDYFLDNTLRSVSYPTALIPTPAVSFAYDPNYRRLLSMQDGIGLTTYMYNPVTATPGANRLAAVDGPLANDTVVYQYDSLGRMTNRAINNAGAGMVFDELGRVTRVTNPLGIFNFGFDGASDRVLSASLPNGQTAAATYFGNARDRLLQQLTHRRSDSSVLSQSSYGFNAQNLITNWTQQVQTLPAKSFGLTYDAEDQLTGASLTQSATNAGTFGYTYDAAGNRLVEQTNGVTRQFSYNALNELISASSGANTNVSYEWDGAQRLVAVAKGNQRSEFSYDGLGRRVRIVEKLNGTNVTDKRFVWCGAQICEERDATGSNLTKRYFAQGMQQISAPATTNRFFYTRDHLGSVREMTDASGAVRARYEYDPYGRRVKTAGDLDADFGFTGHYSHAPSGLHLTLYRAYDADSGRWLSRDPVDLDGGINLYGFVDNDPINLVDPLGLDPVSWAANQIVQKIAQNIPVLHSDTANAENQIQHSLQEMGMSEGWAEFTTQVGAGFIEGAGAGAVAGVAGGPLIAPGALIGGIIGAGVKPVTHYAPKLLKNSADAFVSDLTMLVRKPRTEYRYKWVRCVGKVRYEFYDWDEFETRVRKDTGGNR